MHELLLDGGGVARRHDGGDTTGNTIGCRLYHAGAAAADPVLHCPHAGPTGGNVCGSWCDNYCQLMAQETEPGVNAL